MARQRGLLDLTASTALAAALGALQLVPGAARAMCDVIPGTETSFRGALGSLNRPFAIPGDVGQQITVTLDNAGCDGASTGYLDLPGGALPEDDYFVTIVFRPPAGARRALVITSGGASLAACSASLAGEIPELGAGGDADCRAAEPGSLEYRIPSPSQLEFRFPDTDAELAPDGDDHTLTGPAAIAVTPVCAAPPCELPFELAATRCADLSADVACVDELYARNGLCENTPARIDPVFGHFTALPPANDYEALCQTPGTECDTSASELRLAIDAAGHALVPVDWRGILLRPDGVPVPRLVRGSTPLEAFAGGEAEIRIPGISFAASYSARGTRLPPIFDPVNDPGAADDVTLFGTVDAEVGVFRIARRMPDLGALPPPYRQCSGGANDGLPCVVPDECPDGACGPATCHDNHGVPQPLDTALACATDADCAPGTECGPALFDLSDRLEDGGVGPIAIANPTLEVEDPVPIEGLLRSPETLAFLQLEAIAGVDAGGAVLSDDLNGDADETDPVIVLRDRATGVVQPIGPGAEPGRAVARVRRPPFSYPAAAVEDDLVAFLEPEPLQGDCTTLAGCDHNGDGEIYDTLLRVFRIGDPVEVTGALAPIAVDADPRIDGASLAVSGGRVYFRSAEADGAPVVNRVVSRKASGALADGSVATGGFVTPDARFVGLRSDAELDVPVESAIGAEAFVHDRDDDANGVLDQPGGIDTRQVSVTTLGEDPPGAEARAHAATPDGTLVVFSSGAVDLSPDLDTNGASDVFVRGVSTERVSVSSAESEANAASCPDTRASISADGRYVAFDSLATNLVAGDSNGLPGSDEGSDVFVRDRVAGTTVRVSVTSAGAQASHPPGSDGSRGASISGDGRFVAFASAATNLEPDATAPRNVFVHDRDADADGIFDEPGAIRTVLVHVASAGTPGDGSAEAEPSLSRDGRFVAFQSAASNLVAGDTNGIVDTFLHDRDADEDGIFDEPGAIATTVVSARVDGLPATGSASFTASPHLSPDGRVVAFESLAGGLVASLPAQLPDGEQQVFAHDRLTGLTRLVSTNASGLRANLGAAAGGLSEGGRHAVFDSAAGNLGTGSASPQVFVRGANDVAFDLNGDGDLDDTVLRVLQTSAPVGPPVPLGPAGDVSVAAGSAAFLAPDGWVYLSVDGAAPLDSLGKTASRIVLTEEILAALVPSGGAGFVEVYDWASLSPGWSGPIGPAADAIAADGGVVAFRGAGDGEVRVVRVVPDEEITPTGPLGPATDFVLAEGVLAFRSDEAAAGQSLNGDADQLDQVMFVHDVETGLTFNTGQAAIPCRLEACDPRLPYRIRARTVSFLTLEAEQGELDGDPGTSGLFLQTFPVDEAVALASLEAASSVDTLARVSAGICLDSSEACASDEDCDGSVCYLPPGRCIEDRGTACDPDPEADPVCDLVSGEFCVATGPATGSCHLDRGACEEGACPALLPGSVSGACEDGPEDAVRLASPLAASQPDGALVLASAGESLDDPDDPGSTPCASDADCTFPEVCSEAATCEPVRQDLKLAGAPDADGDGRADPYDNCPQRKNEEQADVDADGIGDRCDLEGPDADADAWPDPLDNCAAVANPTQLDTNADGFGNRCDADYNDDGFVGAPDLAAMATALFSSEGDPAYDPDLDSNGDGVIGAPDLATLAMSFAKPPGPSGLPCAGVSPCLP